ncbi:mechanosensitive ion channel family protein [Mesohalobacter halotolerans]|uniref:Mechanosensitive ion channel n=1 Tax=Mesohalobacter halotolerans TaxID=1883405 RepID=A0A4U5TR46_9FLAO|nr:mechanosensitive ion channel domain-containing protein [Mesohalobacter halotolerans]MBS3737757.1 mechanosensitive ion channel [Psychroflexus sp.]TKS56546.1 mechanosensitive ion channel [Mesohalobacter halotolerans]
MNPKTSIHYVYDIIKSHSDLSDFYALVFNALANSIVLILISYIIYRILRGIGLKLVNQFAKKSKTHFDDYLVQNKTFVNLSNLLVFYIISAFTEELYIDFPVFENLVSKIIQVLLVVFTIWTVRSILKTIKDYLKTLDNLRDKPIDSYIQVFMILLWLIGIIIIFSIVTGKPLMKFLIGLGTISAVILLVFKDTILGFVASIQVAANDTVRIGDWITMEKCGADGDVFEINLASVKVRNFDKTITTIPTYYLISDSFKNWRGMSESGGRRIKRAIIIKANSIKFVDQDLLEKFKKIELISTYVQKRQADIDKYNEAHDVDKSVIINGRNQTNFGVFRKYIDEYLKQHPAVSDDMTIMTRQLPPTAQGVPLEVYCFSVDKVWKNYEYIIADIFDHLLATIPFFELEAFELPSGKDLNLIKS